MEIKIVKYNIFDSPMQTIVNPVNISGVMGAGLAAQFKARYPDMFEEYRLLCRRKKFKIGMLFLYPAPDYWILNFPVKKHWKQPSRIEYIEAGLKKLVDKYHEKGITGISFPMLGCGLGRLKWETVKPILISYLSKINIPVLIHEFRENR